jgi:putative oxidoreductase
MVRPGGAHGTKLPALLFAAGLIETVMGLLLIAGFLARPAAFVASGEMAFAYFHAHFPRGLLPVQNQGDPAVLFCFVFLFFAAAGPGPISLDHLLRSRRRPRPSASGPDYRSVGPPAGV